MIADYLEFQLNKDGLVKNDLMVLDLLANHTWTRPIYFAATMGADNYYGLNEYLALEGLALRLTPMRKPRNPMGTPGSVNVDVMYDNVMNKFKWGNMNDSTVYIDPETARMSYSFRIQFFQLADALFNEGKKDSCEKVMNKLFEILPKAPTSLQYKVFDFRFVDIYYRCGKNEKANSLANSIVKEITQNLDYYKQFTGKKMNMYTEEVQQGIAILNEIGRISGQYNEAKLSDDVSKKSAEYQKDFQYLFQ
jgi:hypothetical protein